MIPILTAAQIRQVDAHTIATEPISSLKLMERAAANCTNRLMKVLDHDVQVMVLAGMGNNGGDGLAMARLCPIGMIFVRCEGGISHHPAEAITEADALAALRLLLETLQHLQPRTFQRT